MKNYLPKDMGRVSNENILKNLKRESFWDEPVVQAHIIDNPKSIEDVKRIKESYINFLYNHYPQLKGLNREEISPLTRKDLSYILHPEMEKQEKELQRQEKIIANFDQALRNLKFSINSIPIWKSFWKNPD